MINFFNFVYTVIVLNYVIVIRNNQDKIIFALEHIQNEINLYSGLNNSGLRPSLLEDNFISATAHIKSSGCLNSPTVSTLVGCKVEPQKGSDPRSDDRRA